MPTNMKRIPPKPGDRIGRLTVLRNSVKRGKDGRPTKTCVCRCDCGAEVEVPIYPLLKGTVVSCGCRRREHCLEDAALGRYRAQKGNETGYKGVVRVKDRPGLWRAQIVIGYKQHRRYAKSAMEAAALYDEMAIELRGPTACLNFPEDHPDHPNRRPARRDPRSGS